MNIKTTKQLSLLFSFVLLAACSTQNTSVSGNNNRLGGQSASGSQDSGRSLPGSQLFNRQNRNNICVDKRTGKAIPGCKSPRTVAQASTAKKLPTVPVTSNKMRKIVLKAPKNTLKPINPSRPALSKPTSTVGVTTSAPKLQPTPQRMMKPQPTVQPRVPVRPTPVRPTTPTRPVVTKPYQAGILANPVRSATPAKPLRPAVRPIIAPAKKPQSTLRRLTLNGSANFKSGSSRLTQAGQTKLLGLALSLQEGSTKISRLLIEGHTDSVGDAAMNQVLSLKRANAVAEFLAKKGGFPRSMMETVGLGESQPVGNNKTRKGRAQNRRVEITATGTRQITR